MSIKATGEMLVAAPLRWDEACFAVPAIRALSASGLRTGVLCPEEQRGFWTTLGIPLAGFAPKAKAKEIAATIAGNWQASIAWEPGIAADAFIRAEIPRRIGPDEKDLNKQLTHPVALDRSPGPVRHRVQFYLDLISRLGVETARAEFFAPASPDAPPGPRHLLLAPDSDFGANHEWPLDRWLEIARALADGGFQLSVAGLPGGRDLGRQLASALGETVPFFDAAPLAVTLPQLAAHALVVSADASLPHLAAHAGATCVTLFGPNDPAWKRPLGRRHAVARRNVECAPCLLDKCPLDLRCQRELDPAKVVAAVRERAPAL